MRLKHDSAGGGAFDGLLNQRRPFLSIQPVVARAEQHLEVGRDCRYRKLCTKHDAKPGEGTIGPELLRTVQWPTQLIGYYAGREEIEVLREDCRVAWGDAYSDRRFHDALLAEGPIPVSLVRLALLGDDV